MPNARDMVKKLGHEQNGVRLTKKIRVMSKSTQEKRNQEEQVHFHFPAANQLSATVSRAKKVTERASGKQIVTVNTVETGEFGWRGKEKNSLTLFSFFDSRR